MKNNEEPPVRIVPRLFPCWTRCVSAGCQLMRTPLINPFRTHWGYRKCGIEDVKSFISKGQKQGQDDVSRDHRY